MQITRNRNGTYSLFTPMRYQRLGKHGFRVQFMGFISDGDFDMALNGLIDERHRQQFTVTAGMQNRGHK